MSYNAVGIWTHTCLKHCIYQASLVHKGRRYDLHFREAVGYCLTRPETFWRRFLCTRSPKIRSFSFVSQFPTVQRLFHAYLLHSFSWTQLSSILVKLSEAAIRTKILRNSQYKTAYDRGSASNRYKAFMLIVSSATDFELFLDPG
jgi:hypothetical protein